MNTSTATTSALPWLAAMMLGATVHVGALVHELTDEPAEVHVVTVPGPAEVRVVTVPAAREPARPFVASPSTRCHPRVNERTWESPWGEDPKCDSESECVIGRELIDTLIGNPALLTKQARVVPSIEDGTLTGYKLYGIRRGTIPKMLGFKNGDLITAINDQPLSSLDRTFGAVTKLRTADTFRVDFLRKGVPMTKEVRIQ